MIKFNSDVKTKTILRVLVIAIIILGGLGCIFGIAFIQAKNTKVENTKYEYLNDRNIDIEIRIEVYKLELSVKAYREFCTKMIKLENGVLSKDTERNYAKLQELEKELLVKKASFEIN